MIAFTKLRMPLFGEIFQALSVARFCRVLGTLLHNGVPILKSLEISRQATGNVILSDAIAAASENITSGESLAKPLGKSGYFPKSVVEMIAVAEESNSLDTVLVDVADGLENRTARKTRFARADDRAGHVVVDGRSGVDGRHRVAAARDQDEQHDSVAEKGSRPGSPRKPTSGRSWLAGVLA
ncbi:MAG: type II secretion system F family protein [Pirellulaceae bacterium]